VALTFDAPPGAAPLDADEATGLIPKGIATRGQLDEYESANIAEALTWAERKRRDVLSEGFLTELHKRMFGRVWRWAGKYRTSGKNIGIAPNDVAPAIRDLVEDVKAQLAAAQLASDEIAIRFHHRMTRIHPFANGNGRHARFATDLLLKQLGEPVFSWGAGDLQHAGGAREKYICALRAADGGDYQPLTDFLRDRDIDGEDAHERK
jgi:Fic-DOC domain mobile mystery protein B